MTFVQPYESMESQASNCTQISTDWSEYGLRPWPLAPALSATFRCATCMQLEHSCACCCHVKHALTLSCMSSVPAVGPDQFLDASIARGDQQRDPDYRHCTAAHCIAGSAEEGCRAI